MQLIDGKLVAKTIREDLKQKIAEAYDKYGKKFTLTVIIAGEDPASQIYVRGKSKACEEAGIISETVVLPETISQVEIENIVKEKVADDNIDGVLVRYRAISTRRACLNLSRPKKTLTASARAI